MTTIQAIVRIERDGQSHGHINVYDSFDNLLELYETSDKDWKTIKEGTILESEGCRYEVTRIVLTLNNKPLNTGDPMLDCNLQVDIYVKDL